MKATWRQVLRPTPMAVARCLYPTSRGETSFSEGGLRRLGRETLYGPEVSGHLSRDLPDWARRQDQEDLACGEARGARQRGVGGALTQGASSCGHVAQPGRWASMTRRSSTGLHSLSAGLHEARGNRLYTARRAVLCPPLTCQPSPTHLPKWRKHGKGAFRPLTARLAYIPRSGGGWRHPRESQCHPR
jgi:hypothetical protein